MKKSLKALLLVGLTISMAVACDFGGTSKTSSSNASSTSSIESSQSSLTSSDSTTSSSSNSSSSTSSNTSVSSSSSSSSSSVASSSSSSSSSSVMPAIIGISLNTDNVKKSYKVTEALDLTGLVVTARYSDNSTKAVTDYTTDPANGTKLDTVGDKTITVSYQGFDETFTITVTRQLESITLNTDNVKKYYHYGDALDLTGLVVTANYTDYSIEVTDYTTNFANGAVLNEMFSATIVVTYGHLTSEFSVEVDYGSLELNNEYIEATHVYGEVFDASRLTPYISYFDDTREEVATFTTTPADGSIFNKVGEFGIDWKATASDGRFWTGYFTTIVSPRAETGTQITLDLSAAPEFENGVATVNGVGTVGSDYTPAFKLTKVNSEADAMTTVNSKLRVKKGDTIESVESIHGVTSITVNGGNGYFDLYVGYTKNSMYKFLEAESNGGTRIYENIPQINYFKLVGTQEGNFYADISSIEFTYTRAIDNTPLDGVADPIDELNVNEGEYIKGNKTLVVSGDTVTVDGKTYTYTGIFYKDALLYANAEGGLLVKYTSNTAVVVRDTNDTYSSLSGEYTKVIPATEIKLLVDGAEVAANTADTRATMEIGDTFNFSATCNAVPTETPVITFIDETNSGEVDPYVGTYTAKRTLDLYDAMTGDSCFVTISPIVVTKENGEYYMDYSDSSDGFYQGFTGKGQVFIAGGGKQIAAYVNDELTIIIDTESKTINLSYCDLETYEFFAEGSIGYEFESSCKQTATFGNGTVKALSEGNFYLTAKTSNGLEAKYYVKVNAYVPATITVDATPVTLKEDDTYQINASVNADATDKTLLFESSNKNVVTVSETGLVTAVKEGTATVTITSNDDEKTINFTVEKGTPKITITTYSFDDENGDTHTLVVTEGKTAVIDDTYNFTFDGNHYVYDEDDSVYFDVRHSGGDFLDYYDENMVLFGCENFIITTWASEGSLDLVEA